MPGYGDHLLPSFVTDPEYAVGFRLSDPCIARMGYPSTRLTNTSLAASSGIGGRIRPECLVEFTRTGLPDSLEMCGQIQPESVAGLRGNMRVMGSPETNDRFGPTSVIAFVRNS